MKRNVTGLMLGAVLSAASMSAMAADGGFFINAEAGGSSYQVSNAQDTSGSAYAGRLGYMWHGSADFGIEGGYVDLGKITDNTYGENAEAKVHGTLLGANARLPMGGNWFLSVRGGWFHSSSSSRATYYGGTLSADANGDGTYFGVGVGADLNTHTALSVNYDNYQSKAEGVFDRRFNVGFYGVSLEYRF